jgi:hypothetical protein
MVSRTFTIHKDDMEIKPIRTLQHKLRVLMNCYTVRDVAIDEEKNEVYFKKTHRINGLKMKDPLYYVAKYEIERVEDSDNSLLKLSI